MDKKKGDKDENGSIYKVDLQSIASIGLNDEIMKEYDKLATYKSNCEKWIQKHNHFVKVRQVAATIPDEYLRSVNLDNLISVDDTRRLIIKGCEAEINDAVVSLENLKTHFKRHFK